MNQWVHVASPKILFSPRATKKRGTEVRFLGKVGMAIQISIQTSVTYLASSSRSWSTSPSPPQVWQNSQLNSSVITTVNDNQWLVATTIIIASEICSLNNSFSSLLGLSSLFCQPTTLRSILIRGCS